MHSASPLFKLWLINDEEAFFGFYVEAHIIGHETRVAAVAAPTPGAGGLADAARSRWPERAAAWIDALPRESADVCDALSARSACVIETTTSTGARVALGDADALTLIVLDEIPMSAAGILSHFSADGTATTFSLCALLVVTIDSSCLDHYFVQKTHWGPI